MSKRASGPLADPNLAQDPVVAWRAERLSASGFPAELARRIAGEHSYDLHAVLELVDRGCPPELAARILAPIEQ